jgi:hypothetical protein
MPIPKTSPNESESDYTSRCMRAVYDEYGQEQGYAICKDTWNKSQGLSKDYEWLTKTQYFMKPHAKRVWERFPKRQNKTKE